LFNQTITNAIVFSRQFCILYCQEHHCGIFNVIKADMLTCLGTFWVYIFNIEILVLATFRQPWDLFQSIGNAILPLNYFLSYHKMYNSQILEDTEQKLWNVTFSIFVFAVRSQIRYSQGIKNMVLDINKNWIVQRPGAIRSEVGTVSLKFVP
jgi:hypothetical protein